MLEPLLQIRSIPMSIEYKIQRASLEVQDLPKPSVDIDVDRGGFSMRSKLPRLDLSTLNSRNSTIFKTAKKSIEEFAQKGIQSGYDATASIVREGDRLAEIEKGSNAFVEIEHAKTIDNSEYNLAFAPSVPVDITYKPGELEMQYERDRLNFDWKLQNPELEYKPGNIEYIIKQYAKVEIEYMGSPMYVPPSANPDYEPKYVNTVA